MTNIKINNLQSTKIENELVYLTDAEISEINGGFRQLFAATSLISGVNSGSSANSETFEQRLQRINDEVNQIYRLAWAYQTASSFIGLGGSGFSGLR
ncbi:hypothetical protein [Nostoc sp. TCL26-01]|uniref:hypothetical protein n=1 Tax=Nostoc sp. TCL26-01 TaxID=2576904 RepID=UPI0015B7F2E5|nr:hypothetical protein [Nostoc sp. TCL26-01]QLE57344.1 hypothetical protein FD725_18550 [Nostoc sp. TCL26-01]